MSEEKILLGMMRRENPPDTRYKKEDGSYAYAEVLVCTCGEHLFTKNGVDQHWRLGHFDTPVYATREEMLDKVAEKIAEKVKV